MDTASEAPSCFSDGKKEGQIEKGKRQHCSSSIKKFFLKTTEKLPLSKEVKNTPLKRMQLPSIKKKHTITNKLHRKIILKRKEKGAQKRDNKG